MQGLIDVDAERARLTKHQDKIKIDLQRSSAKLKNEKFVNNAPADVVIQERERVSEFEKAIAQLTEQLKKLEELV